ncbi:MAG: YeiH family protein [Ruthenibacterium sp.]
MAAARALKGRARFQAGIAFTSKKVLQYAVILLGFGLNLSELARVGAQSLPIICATIATSLAVAFALCKCMKIPGRISVLVGVGSSICGGSAIAATAPVIGADDDEIAQAVSVIFLFNILAALLFPALGGAMGMSNEGFALFAGTAVNDTSSVTAAASTWDALHGTGGAVLARATIVKLTRTLAIIPITLCWPSGRPGRQSGRPGRRSLAAQHLSLFHPVLVLASVVTTALPWRRGCRVSAR